MIKLIKYGIVGFINLLVCVGLMSLFACAGWHYIAYTAVSYAIAIVMSFTLNLIFTFQVTGHLRKRFIRFVSINLTNLLVVEGIQIILIEHLALPIPLAIFLGMLWYTLTGFFLNQRLSYPTHFSVSTS
jgi:putative flippase GtrA